MNARSFKTIFSKRLGALVAVGEHASSQGKAKGAGNATGGFGGWCAFVGALTLGSALVGMAWAGPAGNALPTGGVVAQGAASISAAGAVMSINQSTAKAVLNWNSFDIGQNAKVNITQPGADAVMLNRVNSANPSQIFGQLNANGQVVLVNPNGIVFGKDGSVSASGFTASTLGISDANFMAGNMQFERNGSTAAVVNQGSIKTAGGYVALLGASVSNEGQIETKGGSAYLAAAETVKIPVSGSGRIKLELSSSRINAAVANSKDGTIVTQGGQVYMQAAALGDAVASIIQSGSIDTSAEQGGAVHLLADGGQIKVDGSIISNSTGHDDQGQPRKGGDIVIGRDEDTGVLAHITDVSGARLESGKGFVETSGAVLQADGVQVKSGKWLLDPYDIEITDSANTLTTGYTTKITTQTLQSALNNGTDVTIQTNAGTGPATNVGVDTTGTSAGAGNILVTSAIAKSTDTTAGVDPNASLTLLADKNITVNAGITSSSGALDVTMKAGQTVSGGSIVIASTGTVTANGGNVVLQTKGGNITSNATTKITGANVVADNTGGTIAGDFSSITQGAYSASGINGILLTGGGVAATNNLTMMGSSNWAGIGSTATLVEGKTITMKAISTSSRALTLDGGASGSTIHALANGGASTVSGVASGIATDAATVLLGVMNVKAESGSTLEIAGTASTATTASYLKTRGFRLQDGSTTTTDGTVTFKGLSKSSDGFLISQTALKVNSGTLTVDATTQANGNDFGQNGFSTNGGSISVLNGSNLVIKGLAANSNGTLAETGVFVGINITGSTGSSLTIQGAASSFGNSNGINLSGAATGFSSINILGQNLRGSSGNAVYLNSTLSATGNVLIQSNGGRVYQTANTMTAGGWLTIDNTGAGQTSLIADTTGGLNWTTATSMGGAVNGSGVVTSQGIGKSSTSQHGVFLNGTVNSSGAMYLSGSTADTVGAVANSMYTSGTLAATGGLTLDGATPSVITSTITGGTNNAGSLTKKSSSTAIVTGTNTYKGGTTISAGTLQVGNGGSTGNLGDNTGAVSIATGTNLDLYRIDTALNLGNAISGSGTINVKGSGTTNQSAYALSGNNSGFSGAINITNGRLGVTAANNLGAATLITVNSGGQLYANGGTTFTNNLSLAGNGWSETAGQLGALRLQSNAVYSGAVTLAADTRISAYQSAGSISGAITGSKNLEFAAGTVTLTSESNAYVATTVSGGTLQIGNGGATGVLGSGAVTLSNSSILSFNRAASTTISNAISGTGSVAATITGASNDLTVSSAMNLTAGTINLASDRDLNVQANLATTNATSSAIILNAGKSTAAGTSTGGDIKLTGSPFPTITVGSGGRATLYTGSVSGSTGVTSLIGSGSGNFRYNSDETTTNYTVALGAGNYAIYREAPTLSATINNDTKTYNGLGYSGGSVSNPAGFVNGDTNAQLGAGTYVATNAINVGTYTITGSITSGLGYAVTLSPGTLTVTKADLFLSGTRVYDSGKSFAGQYLTATGAHGETFSVTGLGDSSNLTSKNIQTNQPLATLSGLSLGTSSNEGLSSNYNTLSTTGSSVSVTAKAASVSATATNLTYSGTLQTQSNYTSNGFIAGDAITISGVASGTNAGTYASNMAVSGADAGNYNVTLTNANLVIDKANLTLSGTREYDGTKVFAGSALTATGVHGETFSVTGAGDVSNLTSKNVQSNQPLVSLTGLSLGVSSNGGLSANYNALSTIGSSVSVTAKAATLTGTTTNLTYNGVTQTQSAATSSGFLVGDTITISGLASGKNAGTYASSLSVAGADAGNYNVTVNNANLVIAKASLTATANSSVVTYNGAAQSVAGFTVTGLLGSDLVTDLVGISASGASGTNAGSYTNSMLSGAQTNYTVNTVNGTLTINKAALTATGNSSSVTYNGYDQSVTGFTVSGLKGSDTLASLSSVQASGGTGKNAGTYTNAVTAGTETNYTVTTVDGSLTIGKAPLTATGNSANVTYNGTAQSVSGFTLSGLLGTDTAASLAHVSAAGASGTNAGTYTNTVTVGTETNYTVTPINGTLSIGKANLTLSGTRVYDAGTTFAGTYLTANGVHGETFAVTGPGDVSNLGSKNVQSNQALASIVGLALGASTNGGLSANYNGLSLTGSSVSVTAKPASVTGVLTNLTYDGTSRTQSAATTSGFIVGDNIIVSGLATGKDAGTYNSSLSVGGTDASNYNVTVTNANLVITQAPLSVTATAVTKTYDGGLSALGTGTVGALAGAGAGELVNNPGSQAFLNKDAGTGKTVRASGVTIKDTGGHDVTGNYAITYTDNTSSTINRAALTITANNDARFVTQSDAAGFNGVSYSGFVGGETQTALGGTLAITRTNALTDVGANTYTGVLVPSGLTSSNYTITFANGNYTVVPANQLLIKTNNVTVTYASAASYNTTAQYLDGGSNLITTLTRTGSNGNYSFSDGVGGSVSVALKAYNGNNLADSSTSGNTVVGTYAIKDSSPVVTGSNFVGSPVFVGTLQVDPKVVTPSASGVSKTYDGTTSMNNVVVGLTGKVTGDTLSISGAGAFSQKNAGTSLSYTISGVTLSGADAGNYYLSGGTNSFTGNDGVITAAPLVLSTSNVVKTYDRSTSATGSAVAVQGTRLYNGDTLSGGTYAFTNANAGTGNKTVTVSGVTVNDGNGGANYTVTYASNTTSTINPKALTASYAATNKTYNGNTTASVTGSSSDIIGGDTVNFVNTSANFADKNVGTGKVVTVSGISLSGADAGNYSLQNASATASANITPKALTASFSTTTRAYDGSTTASVSGSSSDMVAGDSLTYSTTTASFGTADAGTGKLVSISGISLGGTDAGNYALQNSSATSTGTISRRDVSLTGLTAANKTYDGTVSAAITAGTIATGVVGESLNVTGSGSFANKNAGSGKTVTVADVTALTKVNGTGNWNNYNLTTTGSLSTTADIGQAALTVTANAVNKTYDGTLTASGSGTVGALAGAGDLVNSSGSQSYLDKNAGSGNKVVRASGVTIKDGNNADMTANYQITYVDSLTGTIQQAPLQIGVGDVVKTYDGTLTATGLALVRSGTLFSGDSLSGGTFAFTDKNYGVGNKTVTVSGVTVGDGTHNSNYALTYVSNTTSTINKAALTVTATGVTKTYDGGLNATGTGTVGTLVAGDSVNTAGTQAYLDANAGTGKTVRAAGVTIKDGVNADMTGNYTITYQDVNTGVINKAALTASLVGSVSKEYDGTTAATNLGGANYSVTGWASVGEAVTVSRTLGTYADATVAGNTGTGSVSTTLQATDFTAVGNTNLANYTLPTSATGNVGTITRAPLTVKVNSTSMFVTQTPSTALDNGFIYSGLKNGESAASVLGALTRTYTGGANPATGTYSAVLDLTTLPTAANYSVTVQKGDLTVVAADKLLINVGSASATYGALTAANAGTAATSVTAQYCLLATNCNGANIANLTMSQQGARWTATDVSNSTISFNTVVDTTGKLSSGGFVNAGNYTFATDGLSTTGTVNFNGTAVNAGVLTVDPKTLTLSAGSVTKVYDGNTTLAGRALTPDGSMSGDAINVASTGGSFAGKNVGSQGFTLTGLQLQGADRANYAFASNSVTGTGTITAKALTLTATAQDKVYDGGTAASVGNLGLSGVVTGDVVTAAGGTASFADKNVARDGNGQVTSQSVNISGVSLAGADAGNYTVSSSAAASATISPLSVSASVSAQDKVYDGTVQAQVTGRVSGTLAGDAVGVSAQTGAFASKNVVRDAAGQVVSQAVTASGLHLTGADAGNYSLSNTTAVSAAVITPKVLQASGAVADKVYDGSVQASLTGLNGAGIVTGDAVTVQASSAQFADRNVSRDGAGSVLAKAVSVTGLSLSGADAGNYALMGSSFSAQAKILPRVLDVQVQAFDKMYDGTTAATGTLVAGNVVPGDLVQLSWGAGTFAGKDVSRNAQGQVQAQAVSFGSVQASGADVGNYSLSGTVATGQASITPKVLQVTGTAVADKMEDGDASAKVTPGSLTGLVGQEQLQATVSGSFRSASVGTDQPVDVLYTLLDGAGGGKAGNYAVPVQVLKASILPMPRSNPIQPVLAPEKPLSSGNKVVFAAQPAMATRPPQGKNESRQECSILNPEKCECQDTAVQGLQLCVMPVEAVSSRTGEQLSSVRVPSLP